MRISERLYSSARVFWTVRHDADFVAGTADLIGSADEACVIAAADADGVAGAVGEDIADGANRDVGLGCASPESVDESG